MLIARRLHDPERQGGIDQVQFVHSLLDELIAVRQDEGPAARRCTRRAKTMVLPVPVGKTSKGRCTPRAVAASRAATASY
jgi:hypothetical protein